MEDMDNAGMDVHVAEDLMFPNFFRQEEGIEGIGGNRKRT
jgi:hypothetical protein